MTRDRGQHRLIGIPLGMLLFPLLGPFLVVSSESEAGKLFGVAVAMTAAFLWGAMITTRLAEDSDE